MSLRVAALAAFLAGLLGGCNGCNGSTKGAPGTDAAASVSPSASASGFAIVSGGGAGAPKPRDATLAAVAEGTWDVKLAPTFDGRIVIVSGSMPFEAKANGALEPIVSGAGLAALYPDDDTFVGFLAPSTSVQWVRGDLGGPAPLFIDGFLGRDRKTFAMRDGKLAATALPFEAHHVVRWRGKLFGASWGSKQNEMGWVEGGADPVPPPVAKIANVTGLAVDAQGTLVVLGFGSYDRPRAAFFPATWKPGDAPTVIEGTKFPSCSMVPSFDARVVIRCSDNEPGFGDGTKFFEAKSTGFERVFPEATTSIAAASIGKDGALYVGLPKKLAVERCPAPAGRCTPLEVKTDTPALETAQYVADVSDVVERKGEFDMGDRSWTTIRIESSASNEKITSVASILARDEHDVWLFGRDVRRGVLFHATDDAQRPRARLPSQIDGRFIAKNASAPQTWTGHCEQVFVRLRGDDAKLGEEIEKVLGTKSLAYDAPFHWWVVEGRLHEDKVSGVVIVRRDVEEPLDKMERATDKLVDKFTPDPMSKPKVYCTLPVLDRVVYSSKP